MLQCGVSSGLDLGSPSFVTISPLLRSCILGLPALLFMSHLLQCLFFFEAHFFFEFQAQHIAGRVNWAADALSRNQLSVFQSLYPQAPPQPTPVPSSLASMLFNPALRWTSMHWRLLFHSTLQEVCHMQQEIPTGPQNESSYIEFCLSTQCSLFPVDEWTLCLFSIFLAEQGLKPVIIPVSSSPPPSGGRPASHPPRGLASPPVHLEGHQIFPI